MAAARLRWDTCSRRAMPFRPAVLAVGIPDMLIPCRRGESRGVREVPSASHGPCLGAGWELLLLGHAATEPCWTPCQCLSVQALKRNRCPLLPLRPFVPCGCQQRG